MEARELVRKYKSVNTGEATVPFVFGMAKGCYVYDRTGKKLLDFSSGYGVTNTGWMHPKVIKAISIQLAKATYAPPWLPTEEALQLSETLLDLCPGMTSCIRATGGAEAMEGILKAVFALTGKRELVSFKRSYHGGTERTVILSDYVAFNLSDMPKGGFKYHKLSAPWPLRYPHSNDPNECTKVWLKEAEQLLATNHRIAAMIVEPVLGSGGVIIPPSNYLYALQDLCRKYGVLFILDEVITGFGRLGAMTATELFGLQPDAVAFAKGMGSGYVPIGAGLVNKELSDAVRQFEDVTSTFSWTPLAVVATLTNISVIKEEGLVEQAQINGAYLLRCIQQLFQLYLPDQTAEVRGIGMAIGIELVKDMVTLEPYPRLVNKLLLSMFLEGLMCVASWDSRIIVIMPPLTISKKEIDEGLSIMEKVLKRISG